MTEAPFRPPPPSFAFAPHPGFAVVGDGAQGVRQILRALTDGADRDRLVVLSRSAPPALGEAGFAVALETSGTTGAPKTVRHRFDRLTGRLRRAPGGDAARWLLTYHPCSFAGLQVILTAALNGAVLIAPPAGAGVAAAAAAAVAGRATCVSGTPSFWRGFLMSHPPPHPALTAATLGGEAADQAVLDQLRAAFPGATLRHIYASTEAGALFAVADGREGFPARWLEDDGGDNGGDDGGGDDGGGEDRRDLSGVRLRLADDGELWVNSPRAADAAGAWLATGDLAERRGDRVVFIGRKDGRVNVGGVKVSPEAAETLILAVEGVADALVAAVPNPITGNLLTATIVPRPNADVESLRLAVRDAVSGLPPAARPRVVSFADALPLSASGKKSRVAA